MYSKYFLLVCGLPHPLFNRIFCRVEAINSDKVQIVFCPTVHTICVLAKQLRLTPRSGRLSPTFSFGFHSFSFHITSTVHFRFSFLKSQRWGLSLRFSWCGRPNSPAPFIEKTILSLLYTTTKKQLTIEGWAYFYLCTKATLFFCFCFFKCSFMVKSWNQWCKPSFPYFFQSFPL